MGDPGGKAERERERRTRSAASSYFVEDEENQPVEEIAFLLALARKSTAEGAMLGGCWVSFQ